MTMRFKGLLAALLVLLPGLAVGQDLIRYYPPAGLSAGGTATGPILLADGTAAAPSLAFTNNTDMGLYRIGANGVGLSTVGTARWAWNGAIQYGRSTATSVELGATGHFSWSAGTDAYGTGSDTFLYRDAANTLALRFGTNAQTFNVYNSFTTAGSNYGRFAIVASATGTDLIGQGAGATIATGAFRSLQGSVSKTLTDAAAAVSFVRIAVPTNGYIGGKVIATANSTDGTNRLTTTSEWYFAGADTAGTVTCGAPSAVGTPATAYRRGNTLICTLTSVTSTTNCDLRVTCTDNLAGDQTPIFEWRLDMPSPATVTPQ